MSELEVLRDRLFNLIWSQCNTKGCEGCGLKFDGGCSATEINSRIMEIEMSEDYE